MFVRKSTIIRKNRRSINRASAPPQRILDNGQPPHSPSQNGLAPSVRAVRNGIRNTNDTRHDNLELTAYNAASRHYPIARPTSLSDRSELGRSEQFLELDNDRGIYTSGYHESSPISVHAETRQYSHTKTNVCVNVDYNSLANTGVTVRSLANENDDRNYFTYEAHVKAIDLDDVHHDGSAILLQIREVNKEATTSCEFIYKVCSIICNSIAATVCLGVLIAIPVAMISVGVKYLNECPKQPKIPIYLLVGGCFGLLFLLVVIWRQIQHRRFESLDGFDDAPGTDGGMDKKSSRSTDVILALFHIAWLILGTHWVFGIWKPHFSQLLHEPNNWCDKTMYMFAVFQILLCYSLFGLALVVILGFCICYQVTILFETSVR